MKNKANENKRVSYALLVAGILALGAHTAVAGEVDGKGNPVPGGANGKSECSNSGQQDDDSNEGVFKSARVQSWGQLTAEFKALFRSFGLHPGNACNPKKSSD